jgi:SAM-dependent methyltransferase
VSYKVYLWDWLDPIEWSQARWRKEGDVVSTADCEEEMIHRVMLDHLPPDGLILDAGCGSGKWLLYLRQRGFRRVMGMDISAEACRVARDNAADLPLLQGDGRRIPVRAGTLDAVVSLGVVEHDEAGPVGALREIHRVLKPGGLLLLSVPYDNLLRRLVVNHLMTYVTWRRRRAKCRLGFSEYRFNAREMRSALRASAFAPVRAYPNDLRPPRNIGVWVDHSNLTYTPSFTEPTELFTLTGWLGTIMSLAIRHCPWLVCGEIVYLARAA